MNLPLHYGLLGSLEAGLIALLIGVLVYALWALLGRYVTLGHGHAVGWACLIAVAIGAGYDIWNLFYTSIAGLESPLYARLALARIHDPNELGSRVVLEITGALGGVGLAWWMFSHKSEKNDGEAA